MILVAAVTSDTNKLLRTKSKKPVLPKMFCAKRPVYPRSVGILGIQTGGYVNISLRSLKEVDIIHKNGKAAAVQTIRTSNTIIVFLKILKVFSPITTPIHRLPLLSDK
jgi:hypothetical protein